MSKKSDLTGKVFGRLKVIKEYSINKYRNVVWLCLCECGKEHFATTTNLINSRVRSCGCLQREELGNRVRKHGKRNSRLYSIYVNMKNRCYNKKNKRYLNYGGRGIKICEEWLNKENGFINFYNWALKNGYKDNLTIDRIDVNGNYEPNNCRWATTKQQSLNTTRSHILTFNNESHTIYEWSIITGIDSSIINSRINQYKWSVERTLTEKPFKGKNQHYKKGK